MQRSVFFRRRASTIIGGVFLCGVALTLVAHALRFNAADFFMGFFLSQIALAGAAQAWPTLVKYVRNVHTVVAYNRSRRA